MTGNLPATMDDLSFADLKTLLGQGDSTGNQLPSLRVNYDDQDDDGNDIPRGQWTVFGKDGPVFAKEAQFRIMYSTYQYSHYDSDEQKMIATSVHFRSFSDEVPDDVGGFKCGKVAKKNLPQLTEAEQAVQKSIKCSRVLYGLLSMEGVDRKGEPAKIENMPCVFYARGSNFMPMTDYIEALTKANKLFCNVVTNLALKREKNGGVVYWEAVPTQLADVTLTKDDFDLVQKFAETVKAENDAIMKKWEAARAKMGTPDQRKVAAAITSGKKKGAVIDPDLNDDIPDLIQGQSGDLTLNTGG